MPATGRSAALFAATYGNAVVTRASRFPTPVTYDIMGRLGAALGQSDVSWEKNGKVPEAGLKSLEICQEAGVDIGFGTDLLGELHADQSREFLICREVMSPADIIRSATLVNARLVRREG